MQKVLPGGNTLSTTFRALSYKNVLKAHSAPQKRRIYATSSLLLRVHPRGAAF